MSVCSENIITSVSYNLLYNFIASFKEYFFWEKIISGGDTLLTKGTTAGITKKLPVVYRDCGGNHFQETYGSI